MTTMAMPISTPEPISRPVRRNSRSWPTPAVPTKEAMTTMARHSITTWLMPTSRAWRAAGNSTFHSIWRGVQPDMTPASMTSLEMPWMPRIVSRAMGGTA